MSATTKTTISISGTILKSFHTLEISQTANGHHSFTCEVFVDHIQKNGNSFSIAQGFVGKVFKVKIEPTADQVKHNSNLGIHNFTGVVMRSHAGNAGGEKGQAIITIIGYSGTKVLEDEGHTLAHYKKTLSSILTATLRPYPTNVLKRSITPNFTKQMEYVVQNRESAWDFIKRMGQRFGQWVYYDGNTLKISPTISNGSVRMKLHTDLLSFSMSMNVMTNQVELQWYDYTRKEIKGTPDLQWDTKKIGFTGGNGYSSKAASVSQSLFANKAHEKFLDPYQKSNEMAKRIKEGRVAEMVHLFGTGMNPGAAIGKRITFLPSSKGEKQVLLLQKLRIWYKAMASITTPLLPYLREQPNHLLV